MEKVRWKAFFRFVKKGKFSWGFIIVAIIFGLISSTVISLIPDATGQIYAGDFSLATLGSFFMLTVVSFAVSAVTNLLMMFAKAKSTRGVRGVVWDKMLHLKATEKEAQSADTMLTAITSDTKLSVNFIIETLVMVPSSIYLIISVLSMAGMMNMKLLWVMFVLVPVYIVYGIFVGRWQEKTNYRMQLRIGKLTGYLSERLYNLDLVKAYTNEPEEAENGRQVSEKLYKANLQSYYVAATATGYVLLTDVIATVLGIAWGSYLLRQGEIDVEAWMTFFVMVPMINEQMRYLVQLWVSAKGMLGYSKRVVDIMEAKAEVEEGEAVESIGALTFTNVSFAYEDKPVINQVSFTIPQNKYTAIVGVSGSGKTTLLNLIDRIYVPSEGTITMDGQDINKYQLQDYRGRVNYIQQDAGIFSGTIREAICYGIERDVTEEELTQAAKDSGIYEDIMSLPMGMDSKVALWGESLSGGQKQKIVIARSALYQSDMILLDEPTRALDQGATMDMHDTIRRLFDNRTIVIVTHDLELAKDADQIIVMNRGKVESYGSHEELVKACPFYQNMIAAHNNGEV